jgi:aspergillopepsin I
MPSIASFAAIAGLAGLAIASPLEKRAAAGSFRLDQVVAGPSRKVGPVTLQRAYQKYSAAVPANVAAAAAVSGSVVATPEQYDSEYLCPVTIGSTTLNLDFDTGSADL